MRTCSLRYCTDIVCLSIIVILSLCLTLWKSHFIFSLGFNLFCALRKFFHSVTFTVAFSVFFRFPHMEPKGIIHLEERFSFIFHIKKKKGKFKITVYQLTLKQSKCFNSDCRIQTCKWKHACLLTQHHTGSYLRSTHL